MREELKSFWGIMKNPLRKKSNNHPLIKPWFNKKSTQTLTI